MFEGVLKIWVIQFMFQNFSDYIEYEFIKMEVNFVFIFNVIFFIFLRDYWKDLNNLYFYESELQIFLKLIRVKIF